MNKQRRNITISVALDDRINREVANSVEAWRKRGFRGIKETRSSIVERRLIYSYGMKER